MPVFCVWADKVGLYAYAFAPDKAVNCAALVFGQKCAGGKCATAQKFGL